MQLRFENNDLPLIYDVPAPGSTGFDKKVLERLGLEVRPKSWQLGSILLLCIRQMVTKFYVVRQVYAAALMLTFLLLGHFTTLVFFYSERHVDIRLVNGEEADEERRRAGALGADGIWRFLAALVFAA